MKITKKWLQKNRACSPGVQRFLSQDETDAAKIMLGLIECGRPEDSRWVTQKLITTKKQAVLIAVFAAECVLDIFEKKYPDDKRPRNAINAAKAWLKNSCKKTKEAAEAAVCAAYDAAAAYAAADYAADAKAATYAAEAAVCAAAANAADTAVAYAAEAAAEAAICAAYAAAEVAGTDKKEVQLKIANYAIKVLKL